MSLLAAWALAAAQRPADARELVAWHAAHGASDAVDAPRAAEWRERLFVYQGAGAEAEAWEAVAALERLAPGDADAGRYAVQLAAWDPARWRQGLAWAEAWPSRHPDRSAAEHDAVGRAREALAGRVAARDEARGRRAARAWVPPAALLLLGAAAALALRGRR